MDNKSTAEIILRNVAIIAAINDLSDEDAKEISKRAKDNNLVLIIAAIGNKSK